MLAVDIGNTHTVIGLYRDRSYVKSWRLSTHPMGTVDEWRLKVESLVGAEFDTVMVSSVVPSATYVLERAFENRNVKHLDHRTPFSFVIRADPPSQVGADRLVNAEAALRAYGAPVVIVDSGTATTVCAVNRKKEYLGGAIMPGVEGSMEALSRKAAQLFPVEHRPPKNAIGTDTKTALQSGITYGYACMVDGMVRRFKAEMQEPRAKVVATGGVSQLLRDVAQELDFVDPDLTLKGIAFLYETLRSR